MQKMFVVIIAVLLFSPPLVVQGQSSRQRAEEIRTAVETYAQQKTAGLGYEIRIKRYSISEIPVLPEGGLEYEIVAPQQWEGWGNTSLAVIIRQGERVLSNISGRIEVEALVEMAVAVHQIDHGSIVGAGDVILKKQDVSGTQGRYLGKITDVVGKKARSTIRPNTPFKPDQLEKVALVKSGQIVTIVAENDRMRITITGKAKSAGGEGDMINVQNTYSLKEFPARVIDASTVTIAF
jgi:flagella basal body P-ring formation protein FlgA